MLPKPLNQALPLPGRGLPLFQLENGERSMKTALPSYQQLQRQPFPLPARHDGGARRGTAGHSGAHRFPPTTISSISSISSAVLASRPGHCCLAPPSICRHPLLTPPSPCDMNSNTCFALPGHPRLAPPRLYPFLVCLTSRAHCQPSALSCELEPVGRSSVCLLHDLFAACDSGLSLLL